MWRIGPAEYIRLIATGANAYGELTEDFIDGKATFVVSSFDFGFLATKMIHDRHCINLRGKLSSGCTWMFKKCCTIDGWPAGNALVQKENRGSPRDKACLCLNIFLQNNETCGFLKYIKI